MKEQVPPQLVDQRIHNRIIEELELLTSEKEQREYQQNVPIADVFYELFEQWDDSVLPDEPIQKFFHNPVYTEEEIQGIEYFDQKIDKIYNDIPEKNKVLDRFIGTAHWHELRNEAEKLLLIFLRRGKMPEDELLEFGTEQ